MRIGLIAQPVDRIDPPVQGGSLAIWIDQVARRLSAHGHETFVLSNYGDRFKARVVHFDDVTYVSLPTIMDRAVNRLGRAAVRWAPGRAVTHASLPTFAAPWSHLGYALSAARALKQLKCEAALVMNYSQFAPVIRRVYPACKIYLYMQCEWLTQLDRAAMSRRMAAADLVGGCSEYITEKTAKAHPEHAAKCVTLRNAATPIDGRASPTPDSQDVLFVGRVSPEKGIHVLVDAFHQVIREFPAARLRVVGGIGSAPLELLVGLADDPAVAALRRFYEPAASGIDPYMAYLRKAAGHELDHRIFFEGRVDHDRIHDAYRSAAVLVNPSLSESFGMSLVEAMMHGVPVIATRVGGMPWIVDGGKAGCLVNADDPRDLAAAICDVLGDESKRRQLGEIGRKRAIQEYSWERTATTLVAQLASATSG
jgi:glycosyltransferase involved in cell wall biosynthesis